MVYFTSCKLSPSSAREWSMIGRCPSSQPSNLIIRLKWRCKLRRSIIINSSYILSVRQESFAPTMILGTGLSRLLKRPSYGSLAISRRLLSLQSMLPSLQSIGGRLRLARRLAFVLWVKSRKSVHCIPLLHFVRPNMATITKTPKITSVLEWVGGITAETLLFTRCLSSNIRNQTTLKFNRRPSKEM